MMKMGGLALSLILPIIMVITLLLPMTVVGETKNEQEPVPVERAFGLAGIKDRWDAVSLWVKLKLLDFLQPNAREEEKNYGGSTGSHTKKVVKEAATKTMETNKEAVEQTAKSAAEVVDDAVHKAKGKVKASVDHEEL